MAYRVDIGAAARRSLKRLPASLAGWLDTAIRRLAEDARPPGATKVSGLADTYRIRVGDYRIVYEVHDDVLVVLVIRIGHRREIYRNL